ncbi:MAG: replicative DNA helicase [Alphaproteobacteria bacterium]|nr:replicative DNA helicase [Alphaproteobacteria bacterium]
MSDIRNAPVLSLAANPAGNVAALPGGAAYRSPPSNVEAEQALLGVILVNNDCFHQLASFLEPVHFYDPVHARIFDAISKLIHRGLLASPVTLKNYFERDEGLAEIGGTQYLARLAGSATTIINAEFYGRLIHDLAVRRGLIRLGEDVVNRSYDAPVEESAASQIEEAEAHLFNMAERGRYEGGLQPFKNALTQSIDVAAKAYERDGGLSGLATSFIDLDRLMGGMHNSDLIIIAGRPSMGKTALATNIAFNVAKELLQEKNLAPAPDDKTRHGIVAFFSLEMSSEQLATRILSEQSGITSEKIRRGQIEDTEFKRLVTVSQELQELPLYIDDTGALQISALTARARRIKRLQGLRLIVVDYLQLVRGSGFSADSRVQEISAITQGLKAMAKDLNVPVVALSQLSRQVEQREDKRPQLSDLRESGSIEQDADVVMFVYREEYYLQKNEPREDKPEYAKWIEEMDKAHGLAEIIIGKQRHGPTGTVRLAFHSKLTKFDNLAKEGY